jgi:glycerol-3-phosphate cytidylyltransferase
MLSSGISQIVDSRTVPSVKAGLAFHVPTVGFCCGAFDCLHPGHILMLADAAGQCDILVVGLHANPHWERPEKNEPVQTIDERIMVLQAIKYVTEVKVYNTESELADMLYALRPDVRIIGSDWQGKAITAPGASGRIHWHKRQHDWSSSAMRRRIWQAEEKRILESVVTE